MDKLFKNIMAAAGGRMKKRTATTAEIERTIVREYRYAVHNHQLYDEELWEYLDFVLEFIVPLVPELKTQEQTAVIFREATLSFLRQRNW